MSAGRNAVWTCSRCLRKREHLLVVNAIQHRPFSKVTPLAQEHPPKPQPTETSLPKKNEEPEQGAMSRRLSEMAEETMDTGSKSDRKLMKDMAFSEDLKRQLEERIAQTAFNAENQRAIGEANITKAAGKGTRDQAAAAPWTGQESLHDSTLRMLDDSYKKLRTPAGRPLRGLPPINLKPAPKKKISAGDRLVNARDKTSAYAMSLHGDMTEEERAQLRQELKDRFTPGARPMPTTLQGLTSLANERIEDAIARGQFKNIQRGKGHNVERDYTANSPFLDTTEYFMNKIIQKQEIVPPWIEKQQELIKLVNTFRGRLRSDWKRHAARSIASEGGTVEEQIRKAKGYALTEEKVNPRMKRVEGLSSIDSTGSLTSVTIEERIAAGIMADQPTNPSPPEIEIKVTETKPENALLLATSAPATEVPTTPVAISSAASTTEVLSAPTTTDATRTVAPTSPTPPRQETVLPMPFPFRDPRWEATESKYHTLAIQEINNLTRSYNLMAPKVAQRPYYTVERELRRCFAEVAQLLPSEILERSRKPIVKISVVGHKEGSVLDKFGSERYDGHVGTVRDEDEAKGYGFKQFWKDLFAKRAETKRKEVA